MDKIKLTQSEIRSEALDLLLRKYVYGISPEITAARKFFDVLKFFSKK